MSAPSEKISKAWIYIPIYLLLLSMSCMAMYKWVDVPNKKVVKAVTVEEDKKSSEFQDCFDKGRRVLGGTFALIPTAEFATTFGSMKESCFDRICDKFKGLEDGSYYPKVFYRMVDKGDKCYAPLYKKSIAYHHDQLEKLPLLGLFYNSGKHGLTERQRDRLDGFVSSYRKSKEKLGVLIIGRASKKGDEKNNKLLSEKRGKEIIDYINNKQIPELKMEFAYFGSQPPQLDMDLAKRYQLAKKDFENITYGGGKDGDYNLRLNQSVLLAIYNRDEDPFGIN